MNQVNITAQKPRPFRMSRTLAALMLREMSTTHGRTAFGYLWAILEPAAGILLLTLVFSLAMRSPGLGTNFPLYYASGLLPFSAFMDLNGKIAQALRFSRPLLSFPAVTFVDALLARLILSVLTQAMVISLTLTVIILGYNLDVLLDFPAMAMAMLMLLTLACGVGTLNCYLFFRFPVWERIWGVLTRPLFFISCIFFLFDSVPEPYSSYLWFNPLVHVTGQFRSGVYVYYAADYVSPVYVIGLGVALLVPGILLLRRYHRDILNL